jgi:hypothetical protein
VKAVYKEIGEERFLAGAPVLLKDEILPGFKYAAEFGFTGGDPDVLQVYQVRNPFVSLCVD